MRLAPRVDDSHGMTCSHMTRLLFKALQAFASLCTAMHGWLAVNYWPSRVQGHRHTFVRSMHAALRVLCVSSPAVASASSHMAMAPTDTCRQHCTEQASPIPLANSLCLLF